MNNMNKDHDFPNGASNTGIYTTGSNSTESLKQFKLSTEHQQKQQREEHEFQLSLKQLENENLSRKLGKIGGLFGDKDSSSKNIAFSICFLLLIIGISITFIAYYPKTNSDVELIHRTWEFIIPVITLSLGYIFGKN